MIVPEKFPSWKLRAWDAKTLTDGTSGDSNGNSDSGHSLRTTRI